MARVRPDGGVSGSTVTPNTSTAVGVWNLKDVERFTRTNSWPPPAAILTADTSFNSTVFLTHADATNGTNNSVIVDSSTNALTINRNGTPDQGTFTPFSQTGWACYFNGSSDYISTPTPGTNFQFGTNNFTIEMWFFPTSTATTQTLFQIYGTTIDNIQMQFNGTSLAVSTVIRATNQTQVTSTSSVSANLGAWNHVALVRDSTTTIKTYINGVLGASQTIDSTTSFTDTQFTANPTIGAKTNTVGNYYTGWISNLRVVSGTAVYTGAFTPSTSPLTAVSGTVLLTCAKNRIIDDSTVGLTLTINSTAAVQPFSPFAPSSVYSTSTVGGSIYFGGNPDYIQSSTYTAALLPSSAQDFTIEFWVYPLASSRQDWFNLQASSGFNRLLFYYTGANVAYSSGDSVAASIKISSAVTLSRQWYHIALARESGSSRLFVNGTQIGTTYSDTTNWTNNLQFTSGKDPGGSTYVTGYLHGIKYVKGTALYNANFTVPSAPATATSGTALLINGTNVGIYDTTSKNNIDTISSAAVSTTQSKFGGSSMYFNGTSDVVLARYVSALHSFHLSDFTVEAWVYPLSYTGMAHGASLIPTLIGGMSYNTTTSDWSFGLNTSGILKFYYYNGSAVSINSSQTVPLNEWSHIAAVKTTNGVSLYYNGTLVSGPTAISGTPSIQAGTSLTMGAHNSTYMNAYVDDVRISKSARYVTNFTPPTLAFADQ